jgi:formate dehydrogenase major subunit
MTVTVSIDGRKLTVNDGASVLDAVNASGTYVSQLCKDPDMKAIGACRTCLVQVDGVRGYPASCSVPASEGMKVFTDTPEVRRIRTGVIELTQAMVPEPKGDISHRELTIAAEHHGIASSRWASRDREPVDTSNPVFDIAMQDCILCGRCAQACQDGHQFIGAIDFLGSGSATSRIGTFMDQPLVDSSCTTCG